MDKPEDPPTPEGHVRLYRGETDLPNEGTPMPDWVAENPEFKAMLEATGRWFVRDRETAEYYNREFGDNSGRVSYVDVPVADVENYLSANQPDARRFSAAGRETEESFVSKELAAKRLPSRGGIQPVKFAAARGTIRNTEKPPPEDRS
jgi:hypothetical protein